jgi:pimeloyl-ACP methyl ester carboxylesterase
LRHKVRTRHGIVSVTLSGGEGFPVLMLHGSGTSSAVFERQLTGAPGQRFRLIAPDLPGHGQSADAQDPQAAYSVPGLAQAMSDVMGELGIGRYGVFGWSLGGHVAMDMLAHDPAIAGLMLNGAPPIGRGTINVLRAFQPKWDMLLASKERFTPRDIERYHALCFGENGSPEMLAAITRADGRVRPIALGGMMRGDGVDQKQTVETARVPIAIINGENDPLVRLKYFSSVAYRSLWDGRCHVIEGARHAVFRDRPDVFDAQFMRFVRGVEALRHVPQPMRRAG